MLSCWREHPSSRPTFSELKAAFDAMLLENTEYIQFSSVLGQSGYDRLSPLLDEEEEKEEEGEEEGDSTDLEGDGRTL